MKYKFNEIVACTYFDKNYLIKGISMCQSFVRHNPEIKVYVLCFDDYTRETLKKLKIKNVITIKLSDFEDEKLLKAKKNRSLVEYFWTCTPSLPLYIFKKFPQYKGVIYLDADLFFYSSVGVTFDELGDGSLYTVEHRYPRGQAYRNLTSGRFNVAFQIFTRKKESIDCLKRWREQCLKWCYFRAEDGKMGDQMYLNEWPTLYKNLVVSLNVGVDVAPWNVSQYSLTDENNHPKVDGQELICYHFHQFTILDDDSFEYSYGYFLTDKIREIIYQPYVKSLKETIRKVKRIDPNFKVPVVRRSWVTRLQYLLIKTISPTYWLLQTCLFALNHEKHIKGGKGYKIGINALVFNANESIAGKKYLNKVLGDIKKDFRNEYLIFCNSDNRNSFKEFNNCRIVKLAVGSQNSLGLQLFNRLVLPLIFRTYSVDKVRVLDTIN
jgi:hypothetical protein